VFVHSDMSKPSLFASLGTTTAFLGLLITCNINFPHSRWIDTALAQSQSPIQLQRRTALVVGNAKYNEKPLLLGTPNNDATDMKDALEKLGFEVNLILNADLSQMEKGLSELSNQTKKGDVSLFYFAGHAIQMNGVNYLFPVDISEKDPSRTIDLDSILKKMQNAGNSTNIVILDACRNQPYSFFRSPSIKGLAEVKSFPETFIAFSTAANTVAYDSSGSRNSPYTASLLRYIHQPGLTIEDIFKKVGASVRKLTNYRQDPWTQSNLSKTFILSPYFVKATPQAKLASSAPQSIPKPSVLAPTFEEQHLVSKTTRISYDSLRDLLALKKWKDADQETSRVILQIAHREVQRYLEKTDIDKLSCEDLSIINKLWMNSSNSKFGFSAQSQIYKNSPSFGYSISPNFREKVGWTYYKGEWIDLENSEDFIFDLKAPRGHLPSISFAGVSNHTVNSIYLFSACNM
jgi:hypothetical protein